MEQIRNPFNPERFRGKDGRLTVEESSRLQDLIRNAWGDFTTTVNRILQQFNVTVENITQQAGPQGLQGIPGRDGDDGEQGDPGRPGSPGAPGRDGFMGFPGDDGADGDMGVPGRDGRQGVDGRQGQPGQDGDDGADGPPGVRGADGAAGAPGAAGQQGPPGIGMDGDDGEQGPPGARGADGAPGSPGAQGPIGMGPPGQDGEDGDGGFVIPGRNGTVNVSGPAGFVRMTQTAALTTTYANGYNTLADVSGGSLTSATLNPGETYVVIGPFWLADGQTFTVPNTAAMAVI